MNLSTQITNTGDSITDSAIDSQVNRNPFQFKKATNKLSSMMLSLQINTPRNGWKWYLFSFICIVVQMYSTIMVPTLNQTWGSTTSLIFDILNLPNTFFVHYLTYEQAIIVSGICIGFVLLCIVIICFSLWSITNATNHISNFKYLLFAFSSLAQTFSIFLLFNFVGFYNCSSKTIKTDTLERTLSRFPSNTCFGDQIIVSFCIASSCALLVFVILSRLISHDLHPLSSSPFCSMSPKIMIMMDMMNLLTMIVLYSVPQPFVFVSNFVNMVASLVAMIVHGKSCLFFRRMDNSIFMGVLGARFGTSLGSFVNSLLTSPIVNIPNAESYSEYIGSPLTVGLSLICAFLSFISIEIYTRIIIRNIRDMTMSDFFDLIHPNQPLNLHKSKKAIMNFMESKAQIYIQTLRLQKNLDHLSKFFRFANKSTHELYTGIKEENGLDIYMTDKDLSLIYSKALYNRKSRDIDLLYNLSTLMAYDHLGDEECYTPRALQVMNRVCKKASYWNHLDYHYRAKEIQQYASDTGTACSNQENDLKMLLLKENQDKLICLHRDFWKEMMNELVILSNVERICENISDLSEECEEIFMEALSDRKNKAYLRMYATYVELFHFDKELAQSIHSEANQIDQDVKVSQSITRFKKTQIVPTESNSSFKSLFKSRNRVRKSVDQMSDEESDISQLPNVFSSDPLDQLDDSASVVANNVPESIEQKKDYLFRNALNTRRQEGVKYTLYYLFLICCVASMLGGLIISIINSAKIKENIINLKDVCIPQTAPLSMIRNVRNIQNWIYVFFVNKYRWPSNIDGSPTISKKEYISNFKERVLHDKTGLKNLIVLGQNIEFDYETYTQYGKTNYQTYIPSSSTTGLNKTFDTRVYIGEPESRNVSVIEITNSLIKYINLIKDEDFPLTKLEKLLEIDTNSTETQEIINSILSEPFMFPISNYNFMYLWLNKFIVTKIYEEFCNQYVVRSKISTYSLMIGSEYYFYATIALMITIGMLLIAYIQYDLLFFRRFVKLIEKEISKEGIGKIYQQLNKKTSMEASLDANIVTKLLHSKASLFIAIVFLALFIPLCIGMLYLETYMNAKSALFTFTNVGLSSKVIEHLQYSSFYLGELLTFFGVATLSKNREKTHFNDKLKTGNFEQIYSQIIYESNILSASWNELIYGDVSKPDNDPVIGLYPSLDNLLKKGEKNCTLYLEQQNLTLTLQNKVLYCTGIEKVVTDYLTTTTQVTENTRDFYERQNNEFSIINGTMLNPTEIFMEHYKLYTMSHPLNDKLLFFMNEFVRVSSQMSLILLLIFTCFGFLLTFFIGRIILAMIKSKSNQLYYTRMLMNYIPVEMMERNEKLKNVALFNSFPSSIINKFNRKSSKSEKEGTFAGVFNIINSSVDGSAVMSDNGDIEIFNQAAHRMFGTSSVDVLGVKICSLFNEKEVMRKSFESVVEQSKKSILSGGNGIAQEILEADCLRRNQTKFPAKVTFFSTHLSERGTIVVCTINDLTSERKQQILLAEEKKNSDNLLKNILPENVAYRLKKGETFIAEKLNDITVFFSDMVGFTRISSTMQATELVKMLNAVVNGFDTLTEIFDLEKIKTIGDAYFCVGGLHGSSDHPERMLKFAMSTFQVIHDFNTGKLGVILENDQQLDIRIGINTGEVIGGVIGTKKFAYDLWGDTINTASRMESTGEPGRIQLSRSTYERVYDMGLEFEEKQVEVKGKGPMQSYLLSAKHHIRTKVEAMLLTELQDDQVKIQEDDLERMKFNERDSPSGSSDHSSSKRINL